MDIFIRAWIINKHKYRPNEDPIPVSVVIAARNEAAHLPKLIESLMTQDHPDYEVTIVLDRCSDESLSIMKQAESKYSNLRTAIVDYLPDHFSPKKFALTLGIKGAKYECVLLTDADCLPISDQWISKMSSQFEDGVNFILGYSPFYTRKDMLFRYIAFETFVTGFRYLSAVLLGRPYMAVGRNMIVRKSFFLSIKGYNKYQHLQGGDDDLLVHYHAKGSSTRVMFDDAAQTLSAAPEDRVTYHHQKRRHFHIGHYYRRSSRLAHLMLWLAQVIIWLSFITLAIVLFPWYLPVILFFVFLLTKGLTYWWGARKMDKGFNPAYYPLMELLYLFVMPILVISARVTKKVKWK